MTSRDNATNDAHPQLEFPVTHGDAWIGTDEAGKGDFFGPLVIAAVRADEIAVSRFQEWGVTDSKKLSDSRARQLYQQMKDAKIPYAVVAIGPAKYNELYAKIRNLNRLLAWGHGRVIEDLLEKAPAGRVVADQFGGESLIRRALMERGRQIELVQMHRAERDPAVAAASVIARAEFLFRLEKLSTDIGVKLPKGAGSPVDVAGAQILRRGGLDLLSTVAKVHFKNTQKSQKLV